MPTRQPVPPPLAWPVPGPRARPGQGRGPRRLEVSLPTGPRIPGRQRETFHPSVHIISTRKMKVGKFVRA